MKNETGFAGQELSSVADHGDTVRQAHQLADHMKEPGVCYFIGADAGPIKIGHSLNVVSRLRALQNCSPVTLRVYATRDGGEMREGAYHYQFAAFRLHGEWFARCPEIEAEIARLTDPGYRCRRAAA